MKKHPVDGARTRARILRGNMTEAETRVWQILRSHQMKGPADKNLSVFL
jgi:very-short-patch-repair endonuclease